MKLVPQRGNGVRKESGVYPLVVFDSSQLKFVPQRGKRIINDCRTQDSCSLQPAFCYLLPASCLGPLVVFVSSQLKFVPQRGKRIINDCRTQDSCSLLSAACFLLPATCYLLPRIRWLCPLKRAAAKREIFDIGVGGFVCKNWFYSG